ncbi:MAG: putative peptidoglycan glycosyltransferase FtsW [Kiritimatiellae bacterium]|nr:putative peptidoglycan glycosyltransferase FtsW [Kiritimatiellia bacterium]
MSKLAITIFICALTLTILGIITAASIGKVTYTENIKSFELNKLEKVTQEHENNAPEKTKFHKLKKQLIWLGLSAIAFVIILNIDYTILGKYYPIIFALTFIALVLVFMPGIGREFNGSYRWLSLLGFSVQPSEFAKIALVVVLASWYNNVMEHRNKILHLIIYPGLLVGSLLALIILEPDFGTVMLMGLVCATMMLLGGAQLRYLVPVGAVALTGVIAFLMMNMNRMTRIQAWLHPEDYPGKAYNLQQSLISFARGGIWGQGFGQGIQKELYLPEASTDFILAIIGEEMGLLFTLLVVICYAAICICGLTIAFQTINLFGRLLAVGLTLIITVQALVSISTVTGMIPPKGFPLPFVSYGGTSLLVSWCIIALLGNIANNNKEKLG